MNKHRRIALSHNVFLPPKGSTLKTPVIFLHAMMCTKEIWGEIPQRVADRTHRTVYTYDARNHGDSRFTENSNLKYNVNDLFDFMDEKKISSAILVGHVMGGITAINAALKMPSRFEYIFIVNMFVKKIPTSIISRAFTFMNLWTDFVQEVPPDTPREDVTRICVQKLCQYDRGNFEYESQLLVRCRFTYNVTTSGYDVRYNNLALGEALWLHDASDQRRPLQQYPGPACFIFGNESPFNAQNEVDHIRQYFPNFEMIGLPNTKHFPFVDYPNDFTLALTNRML